MRRWLAVLMDTGSPAAARLAPALGFRRRRLSSPRGYVYGSARRLPDAQVKLPTPHKFFRHLTSSRMGDAPRYFIVCPWEAWPSQSCRVHFFIPQSFECTASRQPVFFRAFSSRRHDRLPHHSELPRIRLSATFKLDGIQRHSSLPPAVEYQRMRGSPSNFQPFRASPFVSILLTLQIVPYFLTGFESRPNAPKS